MKNEDYVLRVYMSIYIISSFIIGVIVIVTMQNAGEVAILPISLSREALGLVLLIHLATLAFVLPFYQATKRFYIGFSKDYEIKLTFNNKRMHRIMLAILLIQTVYVIKAGYGNAGGEFENIYPRLTQLLNLLKIDSFFPIYFVCVREKKVIFWCNTALYLGMRLLQGWSGDILVIVLIEAYLYAKNHRLSINIRKILKRSVVLSGTAVLIGAGLYQVIYPVKFYFRTGYLQKISYAESVKNLISRFTNYPIDIAAIQNNNEIAAFHLQQGVKNAEIISFFRSLVPSAIFKNKDFSTLNAVILRTVYPELERGTSTDYNIFFYAYNLISINRLDFYAYVVVFIFLFLITKSLLKSFDNGGNDTNILYFILVFQIFYGISMENVFAYGYIGSAYLLLILTLSGIIKIIKQQKYEMSR